MRARRARCATSSRVMTGMSGESRRAVRRPVRDRSGRPAHLSGGAGDDDQQHEVHVRMTPQAVPGLGRVSSGEDRARGGPRDARCTSCSGRTRSDLIREAVSTFLRSDDRSEAELVAWQKEGILGAFGVEPDIAESVAELRAAHRRRLPELDARWDAPR